MEKPRPGLALDLCHFHWKYYPTWFYRNIEISLCVETRKSMTCTYSKQLTTRIVPVLPVLPRKLAAMFSRTQKSSVENVFPAAGLTTVLVHTTHDCRESWIDRCIDSRLPSI